MPIKVKITADEFSKLEDRVKVNYKIQPDFTYHLDIEGGFITDKDPAGLLSALEKEREENKKVKSIADRLEKEKLEAERAKITDVEELKKHFQQQLDERDKREKEERKRLDQERLEGQQRAAEALRKQRALEVASELFGTNAPILMPHIENMLKPVAGDVPTVEIIDPISGKPQLDQGFEGFKKTLSTNPLFSPMIVKSKASGGSASGDNGKSVGTTNKDGKPKTYNDYTPSELFALKREQPELFQTLKSQRGK